MRTITALLAVVSLAACRTPLPPPAPRAAPLGALAPSELFPDDLDFVLRIDAVRIRQNPKLAGVIVDLAETRGSEMLASAKAALGDATAVWAGTRWMSDGFHGDGVLAVEMSPGSDPHAVSVDRRDGVRAHAATERATGARRQLDVHLPDVDVFERPASARNEALLEVILRGRGLVLATAAEADGVLRVMRTGPDESRLDPPARGLVSFAGRQRPSAPIDGAGKTSIATSSALHALMDGLSSYAGSFEETEGDAIDADVTLSYATSKDAERAADRAKETVTRLAMAGGAIGTMADSAKLTQMGSSLRVRAAVPFAWLTELH